MSLRFLRAFVTFCLLCSASALAQSRELRICADPANPPFSTMSRRGFENRLAELLARDMHVRVDYQWQRMGRGFVREFINKSRCDLVLGIPANFRQLLTTDPYYRSSYVFVNRRDKHVDGLSLNNPALRKMKIGVQVLDDDYAPPAQALARRGMQENIVGFETTGTEAASIIKAVAQGKVDIAMVWGPAAGYFAKPYGKFLEITPVTPEVDQPALPFTFAISMGVRKGNTELRNQLDDFLKRRRHEITAILNQYHVPQLEMLKQESLNQQPRKGE
jgi:mxaJ protein